MAMDCEVFRVQELHNSNKKPTKYLVKNIGYTEPTALDACESSAVGASRAKVLFLLLQQAGSTGFYLRLISMSSKNPDWLVLRKDLLGAANPPEIKHTAALDAIVAVLKQSGGLALSQATAQKSAGTGSKHRLISASVFSCSSALAQFEDCESFKIKSGCKFHALCRAPGSALAAPVSLATAEEIDDVVFVDDALCEPEEKREESDAESDAERDKREQDRFLRAHASSLPAKKQAPVAELDGELDLETLEMIEDAKREHAAKEKEQQRRIKALSTFEGTMNFFGKPGVSIEAFALLLRELQEDVTDESVQLACELHERVQREAA